MPLVQGHALAGLRQEAGRSAGHGRLRRAIRGKDTAEGKIRGAYLLLIRNPRGRTLRVGKLGAVRFPKGNYVYIGSGMGGLVPRVERHLRRDKKVKWHIDGFLAVATTMGAVLFISARRNECELARRVIGFPGATVIAGFGSSDCGCPGHLVHLGPIPFGALLCHLDGREVGRR